MNSQDNLFNKYYDVVMELVNAFVLLLVQGLDTTEAKQNIINTIVDIYSRSFVEEVSYILDLMDFPANSQDIANIQNSVDTSAFRRSNFNRIFSVLNGFEDRYKEYSLKDLSPEKLAERVSSEAERFVTSELQMCVEKASVNSSKLIENVFDTKLTKTWNCIGDDRSCPICLAMNGITIPVTESFAKYAPSSIAGNLSYTGGDTCYAHPRCRCWLTYKKA